MKTVQDIVKKVYGRQEDAAARFNVGQSAVAMWVSRGNFPPRLLFEIAKDAKRKGLKLDLTEIPICSQQDGRAA